MSDRFLGRVLHGFSPRSPDELEVQPNEVVKILSTHDERWWEVENFEGTQGKLPANHLKMIDVSDLPVVTVKAEYTPDDLTGFFLHASKGETIIVVEDNSEDIDWVSAINYSTMRYGFLPTDFLTDTSISYDDLYDAIVKKMDMKVIELFCETTDVASSEAVAKDLILLFDHEERIFQFLKFIIEYEVSKTGDLPPLKVNEGTLFRKNSLSSAGITIYSRLIGSEYLTKTLKPLIDSISSTHPNFEVDPNKMTDDTERDANIVNLQKYCQMFLHAIMESLSSAPAALKETCSILAEAVKKLFPTARRKSVGGFFFLRFLCPAICSPEGFGITEKVLESRDRRSLILVSKVLQTLSNGIQFGQKEPFMIPMNAFIQSNLENVHFILDKIGTRSFSDNFERLSPLYDKEAVLARIHKFLSLSLVKIEAFVEANPCKELDELLMAVKSLPIRDDEKRLSAGKQETTNSSSGGGGPGEDGTDSRLPQRRGSITFDQYMNSIQKSKEERRKQRDLKKQQKEEEKKQRMKEKEEKRLKEDKKEAAKRILDNAAPIAESMFFYQKTDVGATSAPSKYKKGFFLIFDSGYHSIHYFPSQEEYLNGAAGRSFSLAPAFSVVFNGKQKAPIVGWEIRIKLISGEEYILIATNEEDKSRWLDLLDRRKKEMVATTSDRSVLQQALEMKKKALEADLNQLKLRLRSASDPSEQRKIQDKLAEIILNLSHLKS